MSRSTCRTVGPEGQPHRPYTTKVGLGLRPGRCVLALSLLCGPLDRSASAKDDWHVRDATVRFRARIARAPSHASAGCIVRIPDGGVLPKPQPVTTVLDDKGRTLKHGCLWHDPEQDLVLVFEAPGDAKEVHIYAKKGTKLNVWEPGSGLTPGIIAYIKRDGKELADAHRIEKRFPPGKGIHIEMLPSPALGALPRGMDGPFSDYVLCHFLTKDAGKTWVSPQVTRRAEVEAYIDGRKMTCRKEFPQRAGSTGDWRVLTNGVHRMELYGYRPAMDSRFQLAWKTPSAGASELGGSNPVHEGLTMWAARPIRQDECLHSGTAKPAEGQFRDGSPVPVISVMPKEYVWLDEQPLVLYDIRTHARAYPKGTTYTWQFAKPSQVAGRESLSWLFPAGEESRVVLTAANGRAQRSAVRTFYSICSGRKQSDLNNPEVRRRYNAALLAMRKSVPPRTDPATVWAPSAWKLLFRLLAPVESRPIISELIPTRWPVVARRLDEAARWRLEDMFFDMICATAPQDALKLSSTFDSQSRRAERRKVWRLRHAEALMYYAPDLDKAEAELRRIVVTPKSPATIRAQIRLGDVALLRGKYGEALKQYAAVQSRVKHSKLAATKDWRVGAVRDTAVSETARSLIRQKYYEKAGHALAAWELEFPLSKLSADYIMAEALLLMELGDYRRAARNLSAYCRAVDVTNHLPEAMTLALSCMIELGEPDTRLKEFAMEMKTRFKYHPLGDDADKLLKRLKGERRR